MSLGTAQSHSCGAFHPSSLLISSALPYLIVKGPAQARAFDDDGVSGNRASKSAVSEFSNDTGTLENVNPKQKLFNVFSTAHPSSGKSLRDGAAALTRSDEIWTSDIMQSTLQFDARGATIIWVVLTTNEDGPRFCTKCSDLVATELLGETFAEILEVASVGWVHFENTESGISFRVFFSFTTTREGRYVEFVPRDEGLEQLSPECGSCVGAKRSSLGLRAASPDVSWAISVLTPRAKAA